MLTSLTGYLRGVFAVIFLILNTLFWAVPVYITAVFKLLLPFKRIRIFFDTLLNFFSYAWIYSINRFLSIIKEIEYQVHGLEELQKDEWYLVISNHQTWVDIVALQKIFHGRIPFLKYFLKKELVWVPILGLAWWALDYPFMKRYSADLLKRKPHLKGKDIESTRKACEKFSSKPASIMNFVEGTRFTKAKHATQKSPYTHLLRPRSGGISYVLSAMGDYMRKIIDVTITYPGGAEDAWQFLCSRRSRIVIHIEVIPIDDNLRGQDPDDPLYRENFNAWLNRLWGEKDRKIEEILRKE